MKVYSLSVVNNQNKYGVVLFIYDITEQKKTEKIASETTVLDNDATVILEPAMDLKQGTEPLTGSETEVLSDADRRKLAEELGMVIEDDVTVVNTDVIIQ